QTATLAVADTADHVINASEATVVSFTVGGLDDETGTATFTDGTNVVTVPVNGNGVYSVDLSPLNDGPITSSLATTDAAGNQLNATGNTVALDTDSDQTASLVVADTADH